MQVADYFIETCDSEMEARCSDDCTDPVSVIWWALPLSVGLVQKSKWLHKQSNDDGCEDDYAA